MLKMQSGCCQRITKPSLTPIHAILFKPPCSSCLTLPLTPHLNYHKPQSIKPTPNPSSSNQYPLPSNQFSSTPYHISNPPVHSTSSPPPPGRGRQWLGGAVGGATVGGGEGGGKHHLPRVKCTTCTTLLVHTFETSIRWLARAPVTLVTPA